MYLTIENLSKSFNRNLVLNKLNLEVNKNNIIGIIGDNGSGKTTLLKIISGLMKPDSGKGFIFNSPLFNSNYKFLKHVLYWGHDQDSYSFLSPIENLKLFLKIRCQYKGDQCIKESLIEVGLGSVFDKSMIDFSAGMVQRYHLARMKLSDWDFLLLDEPTNALDERGLMLLEYMLKKYKTSKTTLIASHNLKFIKSHCDVTYKLIDGKLRDFKFN